MRETKGGIKYDVGTKFTTNSKDEMRAWVLVSINEWGIGYIQVDSKNTTQVPIYSHENFSTRLDTGDWIIIKDEMKEVIEIGDIINGRSITNAEVIAITDNGYYKVKVGHYKNYIRKENAILVSKANKQEIIGYELLKDLPGIPAGTKSEIVSNPIGFFVIFKNGKEDARFSSQQIQDTTWFKPIYKAKEVEVEISNDRKVIISDKGVDIVGHDTISFEEFNQLNDWVYPSTSFANNYNLVVNEFMVGCQTYTKEDIYKVGVAVARFKNNK